jgi:hypothetical protein
MSDSPDGATPSAPVIRIPDTVLMERVVDGVVFLNLVDNTYYGLEPIGTRMLELLLELTSVEAVVAVLVTEYQASPEILDRDVRVLIAELEASGLVESLVPVQVQHENGAHAAVQVQRRRGAQERGLDKGSSGEDASARTGTS